MSGGATEPDIVVRVRGSIIQIQCKQTSVGSIIPIPAPKEGTVELPPKTTNRIIT